MRRLRSFFRPGLLRSLPACLIGLSAAHAAESDDDHSILDARLIYSFGSSSYQTETDSSVGGSGEEDLHWDDNQRLRIDVLTVPERHPLSFLGGFSIAGQQSSDSHDQSELDYRSLSGRLNFGLAMAPNDSVQFEILPFAGIGLAELEYTFAPSLGYDKAKATEDFLEYGLNINAVYTSRHGFQFGGGIGYLLSDADYNLNIPGSDDFPVDVEQSGAVYSIFIGTRL